MNLRFQTPDEAADEVYEAITDSEGWLTLIEVAELLDIDTEEDFEAVSDLKMVLTLMARYGRVRRMKYLSGEVYYQAA